MPLFKRRFSKKFWCFLLTAVLLLFVFFYRQVASHFEINAAKEKRDRLLAEITAERYETDLEKIQKRRLGLEDDLNGAMEAVRILKENSIGELTPSALRKGWALPYYDWEKKYDNRQDGFRDDPRNLPPKEPYLLLFEKVTSDPAAKKAFEEMRQLERFETGRFDHRVKKFLVLALLGEAQSTRSIARFLEYDCWLALSQGDTERALRNIRGALAAGRCLGDDPFVVCQLIRMSCSNLAVEMLEKTLAQSATLSPKMLRQILSDLQTEDAFPMARIILEGEMAAMLHLYTQLERGEVTEKDWIDSSLARKRYQWSLGPWMDELLKRHAPRLTYKDLPEHPYIEQTKVLEFFQDYLRGVKKADTEFYADVLTWDRSKENLSFLKQFGEKSNYVTKVIQSHFTYAAKRRCMMIAVAMELHRLETGNWPASQEELVPKYLEKLPLDPFIGQKFLLKQEPDGWIVYSVGKDLVDQGGKIRVSTFQTNSVPTDVGVKLFHKADRKTIHVPMPEEPGE